ncbi:hypothetical protein Ac2012v2_006811 [Leucoagaricus gongylophorus]
MSISYLLNPVEEHSVATPNTFRSKISISTSGTYIFVLLSLRSLTQTPKASTGILAPVPIQPQLLPSGLDPPPPLPPLLPPPPPPPLLTQEMSEGHQGRKSPRSPSSENGDPMVSIRTSQGWIYLN